MAAESTAVEELFVLRVNDHVLADTLRAVLREDYKPEAPIELAFTDSEYQRTGELRVDGTDYPVCVQNLPTVVEAYKTYDDINLVKIGDVGQILVVGPPGSQITPYEEHPDGITPPMRNARRRHFKPVPKVDPEFVSQVERDLLALLNGKAPPNTAITDYEEEYVIDPATNAGSWQPIQR